MKSIGIYTAKFDKMGPWDPDTIHKGLTGSEEAVIYLAKELALLEYKVTIFGDPPLTSAYSVESSNPCYLSASNHETTKEIDIAISWRMPALAHFCRQFALKVFLWPHDLYLDPLPHNQVLAFDDVFWLSQWQRKECIRASPSFNKFTHIYGNGIDPSQFSAVKERLNPYSCIYASNYGKGLKFLLEIWPNVKMMFPLATLDIYYGWNHWGLLTDEEERCMRQQIEDLKSLDVLEHGMVGHFELNAAFAKSSFWTHPCTGMETFCITALRAQLSGAIPVVILNSALVETVRYGFHCPSANDYLKTLLHAMEQVHEISVEERIDMGQFILKDFTWKEIARKWDKTFNQHLMV